MNKNCVPEIKRRPRPSNTDTYKLFFYKSTRNIEVDIN